MKLFLHQTHQNVCDFEEILNYLQDYKWNELDGPENLHIFPELYLCGYPLQDLCLQQSFIEKYHDLLDKIDKWAQNWSPTTPQTLLLGGLAYEYTDSSLPHSIKNVVYKLEPGKPLKAVYTKRLLPNYDIFDEKKYFTAGTESCVLEIYGKKLGILICEDMWTSNVHELDPCKDLDQYCSTKDIKLDALINISASPYLVNKDNNRINRAQELSKRFKAPYCYVNKVGGEDEILFDGGSFICDASSAPLKAKFFCEDLLSCDLDSQKWDLSGEHRDDVDNIWENLFSPELTKDKMNLKEWSDETCEEVIQAITFGVQEYARKSSFDSFTIALSGGMDSSLVLTLLKLSLKEGQGLEAVYMPSIYSSTLSSDLAYELCKKLSISMTTLPIKFLHSTVKNLFSQSFPAPFEGVTDENIQSRLRGSLLYARSNQIGSMVVNTSNKSEIAVGYSTQYGDSVGAISMLGDLYKSQVFRLAEYINKKYDNLIPPAIIERPPSAELRNDQTDDQSLPPYDRLDAILEGILSYRLSAMDMMNLGHDEAEVQKVFHLYRNSEFKRYQFCPIIKIGTKSFGFGYRIPMSKRSQFYTN